MSGTMLIVSAKLCAESSVVPTVGVSMFVVPSSKPAQRAASTALLVEL